MQLSLHLVLSKLLLMPAIGGPSCAAVSRRVSQTVMDLLVLLPAYLLRFTTYLIYSLQTHSHNCTVNCTHIFSLVYLNCPSLCLCCSLPPSPSLPRCLSTSARIHKTGLVLADGRSFRLIKYFQMQRVLLLPYILHDRGCN